MNRPSLPVLQESKDRGEQLEVQTNNSPNRPNRQNLSRLTIGFILASTLVCGVPEKALAISPLHVEGRRFVDAEGRVVVLRGVNVSGNAKVPPFQTGVGPRELDRVAALGMNVIRLLFLWEAYEPRPGAYDKAYLEGLREVARQAGARNIYTILDFHQDGYSRFCSKGAGDGFPCWAVSRRGKLSQPDNSSKCADWPIKMFTDITTHRSFHDFHADVDGVRSRFLAMVDRVALAFSDIPGVAGYDLLNEPWGDEKTQLAPLYEQMGGIIRARHASSILFIEGHVTTNCGQGTRLPRPSRAGFAYAPHYYKPLALVFNGWRSSCLTMDLAFGRMASQSSRWDCPLFLGEFGIPVDAKNAGSYVSAIYDRLDEELASGAQWNLTPGWDPVRKDGWNGEDFSITDASGNLRANFKPRPYPRSTAGTPIRFLYGDGTSRALLFTWQNDPSRGETEIALPDGLFRAGSSIDVSDSTANVRHDPERRSIVCRSNRAGSITLRVSEPGIRTRSASR